LLVLADDLDGHGPLFDVSQGGEDERVPFRAGEEEAGDLVLPLLFRELDDDVVIPRRGMGLERARLDALQVAAENQPHAHDGRLDVG